MSFQQMPFNGCGTNLIIVSSDAEVKIKVTVFCNWTWYEYIIFK